MSVTVRDIYDQVCYDLCEDSVSGPGPITGIITTQQILDYLGEVLNDFLRRTGMVKTIFTQQAQGGIAQYLTPNSQMEISEVFIDAKILEPVQMLSLELQGNWRRKPDYPKVWHQDGLGLKIFELVPAPNWNGTPPTSAIGVPPFGTFGTFQPGGRNVTTVASTLASKETWAIGDTLDTIPDTFTPYLVYGILERVFGTNGEARDPQRALYVHARYEEGVALARAILMEYLEEAPMESAT